MHIMYMYIDQSHACMGITFICLYISSCRCEHATTVFRENSEVKRVKLAKKTKGQLTWQWNGKNALPWIWNTSSNGPCDNCYVRVLYLIRTFDTFCLFIINLSKTSQGGFPVFPHLPFKAFFEKNNQPLWSFFAKKNICFRKAKYLDVASIPKD